MNRVQERNFNKMLEALQVIKNQPTESALIEHCEQSGLSVEEVLRVKYRGLIRTATEACAGIRELSVKGTKK